jgi:hypothetical protein
MPTREERRCNMSSRDELDNPKDGFKNLCGYIDVSLKTNKEEFKEKVIQAIEDAKTELYDYTKIVNVNGSDISVIKQERVKDIFTNLLNKIKGEV